MADQGQMRPVGAGGFGAEVAWSTFFKAIQTEQAFAKAMPWSALCVDAAWSMDLHRFEQRRHDPTPIKWGND
jgi:hypothetical protein